MSGPEAAGVPAEPRWRVRLLAEHRAGSVAAVTGVFANRGVSFDRLAAGVVDGEPRIDIEFAASARLARVLGRTLERLAVVRVVELEQR